MTPVGGYQERVLEELTREQILDWGNRAADHHLVFDHIDRYGKLSAQRLFTRASVARGWLRCRGVSWRSARCSRQPDSCFVLPPTGRSAVDAMGDAAQGDLHTRLAGVAARFTRMAVALRARGCGARPVVMQWEAGRAAVIGVFLHVRDVVTAGQRGPVQPGTPPRRWRTSWRERQRKRGPVSLSQAMMWCPLMPIAGNAQTWAAVGRFHL